MCQYKVYSAKSRQEDGRKLWKIQVSRVPCDQSWPGAPGAKKTLALMRQPQYREPMEPRHEEQDFAGLFFMNLKISNVASKQAYLRTKSGSHGSIIDFHGSIEVI